MPRLEARPIAWNSPEGDAARAIRLRVFVDEQKVPVEEEIDAIDGYAYHVLAVHETLGPVGTGRLFHLPASSDEGHIGRMAVDARARGLRVGAALMEVLIDEALRRGYARVVLDSQVHAKGFYAKFGFTVCGPLHMDCGIPHELMEASAATLKEIRSATRR
jgi:predicted GNAT family N-acyltransferase